MKKEDEDHIRLQIKTMDALIYLPDYLYEEALSETGAIESDEMHEFMPGMLYMEQMLRIFPREITCKYKLIPSWEETFMRWEEAGNEE